MKSRITVIIIGLVALLITFNAGYLLGQSPAAPFHAFPTTPQSLETNEAFAPFWEVYNLVQTRFYEQPLEDDVLAEGAINGLLATLDDHIRATCHLKMKWPNAQVLTGNYRVLALK